MYIAGVGTAVPPRTYTQRQCWEALLRSPAYENLDSRARALMKRVLTGNCGISTRHLVLDSLEEAFAINPDALHQRFIEHAPRLASAAAEKALGSAGMTIDKVDALLISTCTGYLCPGLTSYVSQLLGLRPETLLLDFVGQGCGAAVPNLRAAEALIKSERCLCVLSVCVEVCSAAFYLDNDPGVLISACIFGDGAGAAVLTPEPSGNRRVRWDMAVTALEPAKRDLLRFEQKNGMLRNILSPQVPQLAAQSARGVLQMTLEHAKMDRDSITGWIIHPGGKEVLRAIGDELCLAEDQLRWSAAVFRDYGNLSSSSIFFVLESALRDGVPNGHWWLSSFGAGFTCHGALLEVSGSASQQPSWNV